MTDALFTMMEEVLEAVPRSPHPTNKIAAGIVFDDEHNLVKTNEWPHIIDEKIGRDTKIGNSSGTLHAETNALFHSPLPTEGAAMFITDPFCPNCAKNIVEGGIKTIYIDRDGFNRDFFKRRGNHFEEMSMRIAEQAGVCVYALNSEDKTIKTIWEPPENYTPPIDNPMSIEEIKEANDSVFSTLLKAGKEKSDGKKYAVALAKNQKNQLFSLIAAAHIVEGFTIQDKRQTVELLSKPSKYSFIQEPVNRMMMQLARHGLTLIDGYLYCSQVPTSREQVNMVGAGIESIHIGNDQKCRDDFGFEAKKLLSSKNIIEYLNMQE
ncbi:MAG: deoxycytidylate deaminase [Pseudomonadota bacterium]